MPLDGVEPAVQDPELGGEVQANEVRLFRLPLVADTVSSIQRRAARRGRPLDALALAHELGDVRFASAFSPGDTGRPRWQGAFGAFALVEGERPALLGYGIHPLAALRDVPPPAGWAADPIDWRAAEAAPLRERLDRRAGRAVPFTAMIWPNTRVVDPGKPPTGKRRVPRMREVDIAGLTRRTRPDLGRADAYGAWLAERLGAADVAPAGVRIVGESTRSVGDGRSFQVVGVRLNGVLTVTDPALLARMLLRGVGRRRAYGLGFLALG